METNRTLAAMPCRRTIACDRSRRLNCAAVLALVIRGVAQDACTSTLVQVIALFGTLAITSRAPAQSEILLGWRQDADPVTPSQLIWANQPVLPEAATEDLTEICAAITQIEIPKKCVVIEPTAGKAIAVCAQWSQRDTEVASGVAVWTDWRVPHVSLSFADASGVQFLSCNHIALEHRPVGGGGLYHIVDLRVPEVRYQLAGFKLESLRVTDSGMWACVSSTGSLCTGQFNPLNPVGSVTGVEVPIAGPIVNMLWRKDGRVLVLERPGNVLAVYRTSGWVQTASASGYIGPDNGFQTHPVGRDSFIGGIVGHGANLVTVSNGGEISWVKLSHQELDESTRLLSPSRKFAHTQKHGSPLGWVDYHDRTTQFASTGDAFPTFPPAPADGRNNEIGWLRWDP